MGDKQIRPPADNKKVLSTAGEQTDDSWGAVKPFSGTEQAEPAIAKEQPQADRHPEVAERDEAGAVPGELLIAAPPQPRELGEAGAAADKGAGTTIAFLQQRRRAPLEERGSSPDCQEGVS